MTRHFRFTVILGTACVSSSEGTILEIFAARTSLSDEESIEIGDAASLFGDIGQGTSSSSEKRSSSLISSSLTTSLS
jgi:hypothetical protein